MKVFISWSKDLSHKIAKILEDWLPSVIQDIEPFLSSDIEKGKRWSDEISRNLYECEFGIICLTLENQHEPWILFEAGAMSRNDANICPLLIDLSTTDLINPLSQFQGVKSIINKKEMKKLFVTLNKHIKKPLDDHQLQKAFNRCWKEYNTKIQKVLFPVNLEVNKVIDKRSDREILEETLQLSKFSAERINKLVNSFNYDYLFSSKNISNFSQEEERIILTKTKYLHGLQCQKLLWYEYNDPSVLPEELVLPKKDDELWGIIKQGKQVGELARTLYPNGITIDWDKLGWDRAMELSRNILSDRKPMFEAGFQYQNLFARADILKPVSNKQWDLIEVKSSTSVKEEYLHDMAFQKYVYENAGIPIRYCFLQYINNEYTRHGDLNLQELFVKEDISEQVYELLLNVPQSIKTMMTILKMKESPSLDKCDHCTSPKSCLMPDTCWSFLPKRNIFLLYSGGKKCQALLQDGILKLKDIPAGFPLNEKQKIQVESEKTGRAHINKMQIKNFIDRLKYPLYFLDFETFATAIPLFDLISPYETIPFQYSLHLQRTQDSKVEHYAYLSDGKSDPRPELLDGLIKYLGNKGSIVSYNDTFEKGVLKNCAERFPKYNNWVGELLPRFVDLLFPFKSFHYYHPNQNGSASLKSVLPVLTDTSYDHLEISEGGQASHEFLKMAFADISENERTQIRKNLEMYCKQDTQGMVDILCRLRE